MKSEPKESILAVDDDPVFLELMDAAFGEQYHLMKAEGGEEALRLAREQPPLLILLDLMMPQVSGLEVVRGLRADAGTRSIPVILLTVNDLHDLGESTEDILQGNPNVVACLNKMSAFGTLEQRVREALDRRGPPGRGAERIGA